jgi:hypothetical protein
VHALSSRTATSLHNLEHTHLHHWDAALATLRSTAAHLAELRRAQDDLRRGQDELRGLCEDVLAAVSTRGIGVRSGAGSSEMGGPSSSIASGRVMERGVGMMEGMWCGHDVRKPPRKVGRRIVGYVYEKEGGSNVASRWIIGVYIWKHMVFATCEDLSGISSAYISGSNNVV